MQPFLRLIPVKICFLFSLSYAVNSGFRIQIKWPPASPRAAKKVGSGLLRARINRLVWVAGEQRRRRVCACPITLWSVQFEFAVSRVPVGSFLPMGSLGVMQSLSCSPPSCVWLSLHLHFFAWALQGAGPRGGGDPAGCDRWAGADAQWVRVAGTIEEFCFFVKACCFCKANKHLRETEWVARSHGETAWESASGDRRWRCWTGTPGWPQQLAKATPPHYSSWSERKQRPAPAPSCMRVLTARLHAYQGLTRRCRSVAQHQGAYRQKIRQGRSRVCVRACVTPDVSCHGSLCMMRLAAPCRRAANASIVRPSNLRFLVW